MGFHYNPRKLLEGFCHPDTPGIIWQYDKKTGKVSNPAIGKAAREQGYYSREVEDLLAKQIEHPAHRAVERLRGGEQIDERGRAHLAVYIPTMLKRGPKYRRDGLALMPAVLNDTVMNLKAAIEVLGKAQGVEQALIDAKLADADVAKEKLSKQPPPEVIEQLRIPWPQPEMVQAIHSMTWRFIKTAGPSYFLTSDNPAHLIESVGYASPVAELVFPISSWLALHACYQPPGPDGLIVDGERENVREIVREINRRVASGAVRFIFYHERAAWLASVGLNYEINFKRINWGSLPMLDKLAGNP
jgi:hypothetical protein